MPITSKALVPCVLGSANESVLLLPSKTDLVLPVTATFSSHLIISTSPFMLAMRAEMFSEISGEFASILFLSDSFCFLSNMLGASSIPPSFGISTIFPFR